MHLFFFSCLLAHPVLLFDLLFCFVVSVVQFSDLCFALWCLLAVSFLNLMNPGLLPAGVSASITHPLPQQQQQQQQQFMSKTSALFSDLSLGSSHTQAAVPQQLPHSGSSSLSSKPFTEHTNNTTPHSNLHNTQVSPPLAS